MMMMMMMMMNCFCSMVDRRKAFSLISSRDHCQRSSPSRISDTLRAGFEPAQNLSSDFVDWSCAVVISTTPRRIWLQKYLNFGKTLVFEGVSTASKLFSSLDSCLYDVTYMTMQQLYKFQYRFNSLAPVRG